MKDIDKKAIAFGFVSAAFVFVFGFLAMFILFSLWSKANPSSTLHGLFYYKAAALGDPICLPLIIGALVYHHIRQEKKICSYGKISIVFCIIALLAGIAIQAEWLISDNTGLNWSLPQAHHFNFGGWYHAVFFVIIITVIILLFTEYTCYSQKHPAMILDFVLFFALIFFALLHFIDDYISREKALSSITVATCLFVAICCLFKTLQNYRLKNYSFVSYAPILVGGVMAYCFSLTQI